MCACKYGRNLIGYSNQILSFIRKITRARKNTELKLVLKTMHLLLVVLSFMEWNGKKNGTIVFPFISVHTCSEVV